ASLDKPWPSALVSGLAFTPDGTKLVAAVGWSIHLSSSLCKLLAWDVASKRQLFEVVTEDNRVYPSVVLSPDGKTFAVPAGRSATFYEVATGRKSPKRLSLGEGRASGHAISGDGAVFALAGGKRGNQQIKVWQLATGKEIARLHGHGDKITSAALSR